MNIIKVLRSTQAWLFYIILSLAVLLASVPIAAAVNYPGEDGLLHTRATFTGTYDIVAAGKGMEGLTSGSLSLAVPPSGTVVAAYLYWAGYDDQNGGDNAVTLQVDSNPTQSITAMDTYGPSFWFSDANNTNYHFVYFADITALVQSGAHTYTMTDFTTLRREYGFGIMAVYEDPSLTTTTIEIRDGLDSIFFGFPAPRNSPSGLNCLTFTAQGTATRVMDFSLSNAGISGVDRPNNIYYQTGAGAPPATDILSTGTVVNNPFSSADGLEWDTYTARINVGPNDEYACLQIESVNSNPPLGASILWMMGGFSLRQETPTAVSLQTIGANSQASVMPAIGAATLLLALVTVGYLFRRRRQS